MKNLKTLQKESLLKSKSYGLGKDIFWSLKPHPVVKDLGFTPPRSEVHTFKYQHEKECADCFVSLILTDQLLSWTAHQRIHQSIIPDRTAEIGESLLHIENERGTQGEARLIGKVKAYQGYFRATGDRFHVLFLVQDQPQLERLKRIFQTEKVPYFVALFDDFAGDALGATLHTYRRTIPFQAAFQTPVQES
jgi:hypothetical protein